MVTCVSPGVIEKTPLVPGQNPGHDIKVLPSILRRLNPERRPERMAALPKVSRLTELSGLVLYFVA